MTLKEKLQSLAKNRDVIIAIHCKSESDIGIINEAMYEINLYHPTSNYSAYVRTWGGDEAVVFYFNTRSRGGIEYRKLSRAKDDRKSIYTLSELDTLDMDAMRFWNEVKKSAV